MALSASEIALLGEHEGRVKVRAHVDEKNLRYYQGIQRITQLGMAIPPSMRAFVVAANWCRTVVDTINSRQQIRDLIVEGNETGDPRLRRIVDPVQVSMFNLDRLIYGRGILSAGSNELNAERPLLRAESPRQMDVIVDQRLERTNSAARFYGYDEQGTGPLYSTLYLPNVTVWATREKQSKWVEVDRDQHNFGDVPVRIYRNRRLSGSQHGESQLTDIIPLVDATTRSLTNLQFAQEAHGIPRMFMTGVSKGDFIDSAGNPVPMFEAYFDAIHTLASKDARVGQLTAADLKNFETAVTIYGKQAGVVTGFPADYFGIHTSNPATEGAIRADESRLVRSIEEQNQQVGPTIGESAALALRISTGEDVGSVTVDWHDPATPTVAQRADALSKLAQGDRPLISREGVWDELGWSEARKARERAYFAAEEAESIVPKLLRGVTPDAALGA